MSFGRQDPCARYTDEEYARCRQFHLETGKEMRRYRVSEGLTTLMYVFYGAVAVGLAGMGIYAVYKGRTR